MMHLLRRAVAMVAGVHHEVTVARTIVPESTMFHCCTCVVEYVMSCRTNQGGETMCKVRNPVEVGKEPKPER
jgi:hypothetical protein